MNDLIETESEDLVKLFDDNKQNLVLSDNFDDIENKIDDVMLIENTDFKTEKSKEKNLISKEMYDFSKVKKPFREEIIIPLSEIVMVQND